MPHSFDVVGYVYKADVWCPTDVIESLLHTFSSEELAKFDHPGALPTVHDIAVFKGIDDEDEYSYDSDEFPKVIFRDQLEDGECCCRCHELLG